MISSLDELDAKTRASAERWLATVVAEVTPALRAGMRDEVMAHLCEHLDADATSDDVAALAEQFGDVAGEPEGGAGFFARLGGGLDAGDLAARIAGTLWNPADERLFLPRAIGWGWDLNFGAVAVRLGLIEPDAEAVPFTSTPKSAFRVAAVVPLGLAAATALHYLVRGRSLPARLPSHWGVSGQPDRWVSKRAAGVIDVGTTLAAAAVAGWAATATRPTASRTGALAAATLMGGLGATTTVLRTVRRPGPWVAPSLVASSSVAVGAVLLWLAREGRRVEIEKDVPGEE